MTSPGVPQVAKKWIIGVSATAPGTTFTKVKGLTNVQLALDYTTQDQSDYDGGMWSGGPFTTQIAWSITGTAMRKNYAGAEDPGQAILRNAAVPVGEAQPTQIGVQAYDRFGGPEAYQGVCTVQWQPQGGSPTDLETVNFTLSGVGARASIANPVSDKGSASPGDTFPAEATVTASDSTNAAKLAGLGYVANPLTAWTSGQQITVGTYAFNWSGTAWAAGAHA